MTQQYSNMMSKRYCISCGSFRVERIHRGFLKKSILRMPANYQCKQCNDVMNSEEFDSNEARRVPMFLEQSSSKAQQKTTE